MEAIVQGTVLDPGESPAATDRVLEVAINGAKSTSLPVTISGSTMGATPVVTRVPTNVAAVTLKAANTARISLTLFNNSTANMFFKYGAGASITPGAESYTVEVPAGKGYFINDYNGLVSAIWDGADASGECLVTEVTP